MEDRQRGIYCIQFHPEVSHTVHGSAVLHNCLFKACGAAGDWTMANEVTIWSKAAGRIACRFHARDVHLVMGPLRQESPVRFRVSIDGQRPGPAQGLDVDDSGSGTVVEQRLYQLIRQPGPIVDRTLEIEFLDAGVEAFAFTFG